MIDIVLAGEPSELHERVCADAARDSLLNVVASVPDLDRAISVADWHRIDVIVLSLDSDGAVNPVALHGRGHNLIVFTRDTTDRQSIVFSMSGPSHFLQSGLITSPEFGLEIRRASLPGPSVRGRPGQIFDLYDARRLTRSDVEKLRENWAPLPEVRTTDEIDSIIQSSETYKRLRSWWKQRSERPASTG